MLFEKMQLKGEKTKTGYSTAADVLEKLALEVPAVQKIPGLPPADQAVFYLCRRPGSLYRGRREDSRGLNETITATGRISSTEPNSAEHSGPDGAGKRNPQGFCAKRRLYLH